MAIKKRSRAKTGSKARASRTAEKSRDRNGKIEFRGTLRELEAYARSTKYAANRNIVIAAVKSIKAMDVDPKSVLCKVTFGLMPKVGDFGGVGQEDT